MKNTHETRSCCASVSFGIHFPPDFEFLKDPQKIEKEKEKWN